MGKQAVNIASVDVSKLLEMLNAALAEEWLAGITRMKEEFKKIRF